MNHTTDIKHRPVRTIRLPPEQIDRMLDEMDEAPQVTTLRRDARYRYRLPEIVVLMQQPGNAGPMMFIAPTRNISARGLSFLHGGFVHPGTTVLVQLVTRRGGQQNVVGMVRRCRYVQSNVHEVAIQFKNPIDPAVFCHDAVRLKVLLADDDVAMARLTQLQLSRLNCEMEHVLDGPSAVERASESLVDLVLLDMDLPDSQGYNAAKELRARGYLGMIVGGTGVESEEQAKRVLEAGCDKCLVRPFTYESLMGVIASLQSEPLFSVFHEDPAMADLVAQFVGGLLEKIRSLEQALAANDIAGLCGLACDLKVQGQAFGFEPISSLAMKIEEQLRKGDRIEPVASDVRSLIRLCALARAAPKEQPSVAASSPAPTGVVGTESPAPRDAHAPPPSGG